MLVSSHVLNFSTDFKVCTFDNPTVIMICVIVVLLPPVFISAGNFSELYVLAHFLWSFAKMYK